MTTPTNPATAGAPVTQLPLFATPERREQSRHCEPDVAAATVPDGARGAFTTVTTMWSLVADSPPGRAALAAWAARAPTLASYHSLAAVVAAINQLGQPARSCALLADLVLVAEHEPLAQLAVLRALLPGLRRVVRQRWTTAVNTGPWPTEGELAAEALSAAWEAIRRLAGRPHPLPARLIIRRVERRLRTIHDAHRRDRARAFRSPTSH